MSKYANIVKVLFYCVYVRVRHIQLVFLVIKKKKTLTTIYLFWK